MSQKWLRVNCSLVIQAKSASEADAEVTCVQNVAEFAVDQQSAFSAEQTII